jgi:SAM-dependent methyltransferase
MNLEVCQQEIDAFLAIQKEVRQELEERGYTINEVDRMSDADLVRLLGFFDVSSKESYKETYQPGPLIDVTWGMVEIAHVPLLKDVLEEARKKTQKVLDIGCGHMGIAKLQVERSAGNMVYADREKEFLENLKKYLGALGRKEHQRRFVECDKDDVGSTFPTDHFGAVMRLGVRETTLKEMAGYAKVLSPDGSLFVSNSVERQPIGKCLDDTEPHFGSIDAHLGLSRYVLICRDPQKS